VEPVTAGQVKEAMAIITDPGSDDTDVLNATLRLVEVAKEAPDQVVPGIVAAAGDRRWQVSSRAYLVLSRLGPAADAAVPVILRRLSNQFPTRLGA
jgi:hypothetical protein